MIYLVDSTIQRLSNRGQNETIVNTLTWYIEHHPLAKHARESSARKQDWLNQARRAVSLTGRESFNQSELQHVDLVLAHA